jgi:hypothetical protein
VDNVQGFKGIQDTLHHTYRKTLAFTFGQVVPTLKKGRPFNLTSKETKIISYVNEMQSIDFGLRATEVR